jgi:hypothetical protein
MAEATLEERVATLEQLVAQLMRASERAGRKKDWCRTIGMFDGDPISLSRSLELCSAPCVAPTTPSLHLVRQGNAHRPPQSGCGRGRPPGTGHACAHL